MWSNLLLAGVCPLSVRAVPLRNRRLPSLRGAPGGPANGADPSGIGDPFTPSGIQCCQLLPIVRKAPDRGVGLLSVLRYPGTLVTLVPGGYVGKRRNRRRTRSGGDMNPSWGLAGPLWGSFPRRWGERRVAVRARRPPAASRFMRG